MVVDIDILIDVGRGVEKAIDYVDQREEHSLLVVSVVTQMELIVDCENKDELRDLRKFLERYEVVGTSETISQKAVEPLQRCHLSHGLRIADSFIAASAIAWDSPLASKNQRDYRYIPELDLLPYPKSRDRGRGDK